MRLQHVLWVLVLTFSPCWEALVKTVEKSVSHWTHHHDALSYNKDKTEAPSDPYELQLSPPISIGQHCSEILCLSESDFTGLATAVMNRTVNMTPRERVKQKNSLKILEHHKISEVSMFSTDESSSLGQMLVTVVKAELRDCALVVAYDTGYSGHAALQHLLLLHNPRQVVYVNRTEDLTRIIWTSSMCRGYFFLLDDPEPLLTFATTYQDTWDYGGRHLLVVPSLQYLEAFTDTYIGERTEHIAGAVKSGTEGEWVLYMNQLYWGPGVRRINSWYRHRFTRQLDLFPDKLADFHGAVLKVSTFHLEPFNFFHRAENGTILQRYGIDFGIATAVAGVLNITIDFMETPNGETWGEKLENGSWYGLMGQLDRNEVDIGLANIFLTPHWTQVIDLTAPYRSQLTCFVTRTEPPLPHWQALTFPFHKWTWLAAAVGLAVSGPVLFILAWGSGRCGGEIKILQSLSFAWYYAFGLHFCEAHASLPRNPCTQIFVQFLWLYTMIMTMSYSASLKSSLLVKKQPAMMETFQDLYESGLEVAALSDMYKYELELSTNPYLQGLVKVYKYYDSKDKVFPPLLEGKAVYLENRNTVDYLIKNRFSRRGFSRIRVIKEPYTMYNVAMGLQRHSPLKRKFDDVMGWLQQSGVVNKFFLDALRLDALIKRDNGGGEDSASSHEEEAEADGVIPLGLDHMQGLFIITCFGLVSSLFSFIVEKMILFD